MENLFFDVMNRLDIVRKKLQEAGLYQGNAWLEIAGPVEKGMQLEEWVLFRMIMRITFFIEGIIVHPQIYRPSAGTEVHFILVKNFIKDK